MRPTHIPRRAARVFFGAAIFACVLLGVFTSAARAQTNPAFAHFGEAWGTKVKIGSVLFSGPTFPAGLGGCSSNSFTGSSSENAGVGVNVPQLLKTGTIANRMDTGRSGSTTFTRATSTIQDVGVLDGVIKADTAQAVSQTNFTDGSGFSFANTSSFVSLSVLGLSVVAPAPNTKIDLPGIGFVVINEQKQNVKSNFAEQIVKLIHVYITVTNNSLGLTKGSEIVVGNANAGLSAPFGSGGPVGGDAYGTSVDVGGAITSGKTAPSSIPCLGGLKTNSVLSVNIPNIASTGTVSTSALGTIGASLTTGETTATVQNVNVLGGLIKADVVKAHAKGTFDGVTHTFSSNGSTFLNLTVAGQTITNPGINTTIQLANVGTLTLYHVIPGTKQMIVRMIDLEIKTNLLGLPTGTHVRIGVSSVKFRS
jgi:hypothetical protein